MTAPPQLPPDPTEVERAAHADPQIFEQLLDSVLRPRVRLTRGRERPQR